MRQSKGPVQKARWAAVAVLLAATITPAGAWAEESGNMVVFRGGYMNLNRDRGTQIFTDTNGLTGVNGGNSGWYAGAWLDLGLSKDAWGLGQGITGIGEIGVQLNNISSNRVNNAAGSIATHVVTGTTGLDPQQVELTMLTVSVSPKLKFMEGSRFRPWIIPIGLDFHVISPPSNHTNYLDIGLQFGAGFEFQVWKAFKLGVDARYHLTADLTHTDNSYFQAGPYIGITF